MGCLAGLLGEMGDVSLCEGGGDSSPAAWSSMKRPRLPCVLLLTVPAGAAGAEEGLVAGWWRGGSALLGPAVAPVTEGAKCFEML